MKPFLEPILYKLRVGKIKNCIVGGSKVCDICCGETGRFLYDIKNNIVEGVGFDKEAMDYFDGKIKIKKIELDDKVEASSDYFDYVTMLAALEHLADPKNILKESFRILKPGGKLLITTPSPLAKPILEFLSFKIGIVSPEQIIDHKFYFSPEALKNILFEAGFQDKNIKIKKFEFGCNILAEAQK